MLSKVTVHVVHHTHWDPIWYFSPQDALVQFSYNMKELLDALESGLVTNFFLDGQTAAIDEYLEIHPEDRERIKRFVEEKRLFIGPFNSQLDCFISNGESVINNLRLGIKSANELGGSSKIAYLPDSFGHSYDFPKIFNQMGIEDFVVTRGVGDEYGLGSEFFMESNDGSKILVYTMISGYGFGTFPFKAGTLFSKDAVDYNEMNLDTLFERLEKWTNVPNEILFPLGFDQHAAILDVEEKIEKYNREQDKYYFKLTTWEEFMKMVREKGVNLKTHKSELYSTQYHRVHKSIFSARSDIKYLQDVAERTLTYEVQPLMAMLDGLGIEYDHGIIDKAWETLVKCQTHSSATMPDGPNEYIKIQSKAALDLAVSAKVLLMKLVATSIKTEKSKVMPLVVFNTLPYKRDLSFKLNVYTKGKDFKLMLDGKELDYTVVSREKGYSGSLRKDPELLKKEKFYYKTTVTVQLNDFDGTSYKTIYVLEDEQATNKNEISLTKNSIENSRFKITLDKQGIKIFDKKLNKEFERAIYIEESGDEGDNYDYSYPNPEDDLIITHYFEDAKCSFAYNAPGLSEMQIEGGFKTPSDLEARKNKTLDSYLSYKIIIRINETSNVIEIKGSFNNNAKNHRVRIVFSNAFSNEYSYAGTQFGFIKRETEPAGLKVWKEEKWFEEPSPTNPLLNHVSAVGKEYVLSVFTRSVKEYEFIGQGKKDVALTIFRSVGHFGLPDLNRRPGRPSGLVAKIIESPNSQMIGEIKFEIGLTYYSTFDPNIVTKDYIAYATDTIYYQNQKYDTSVFPISFFPTNPLPFEVPDTFKFLELSGSEAAFGTLVKAQDNNGYILRVYNNENKEIAGGNLEIYFKHSKIYKINLLEEILEETDKNLGMLKPGELRNIKIIKD